MRKRDELSQEHTCMANAHPHEMTFVLIGRDAAAPVAIRAWVAERLRLGKNGEGDAQIVEALACAQTMEIEGRKWVNEPADAVSPSDQLRADLAAANRTITQLREDAARVQGRLEEAIDWINDLRVLSELVDEDSDELDAFLCSDKPTIAKLPPYEASGSSTGEATDYGNCCAAGVEPAAPEPAPALTRFETATSTGGATTVTTARWNEPSLLGHCGGCTPENPSTFCNHSSHFPPGPVPAAPASAQWTTLESLERHQGIDRFEAQSNARNIAQHCERLEAEIEAMRKRQDVHDTGARQIMQAMERMAHRVDALEAKTVCMPAPHRFVNDGKHRCAKEDCGEHRDSPIHTDANRPAAPPQPAPVERHAFVAGPGLNALLCWHPTGIPNDVCGHVESDPIHPPGGQPRSAAVHGEGGGNG